LADALNDAADHLPLGKQRVEDNPHIVHRRVADEGDMAGLLVDLDLADMRAIRPDGRRSVVGLLVEPWLDVLRQGIDLEGPAGDIDDADSPVGPGNGEAAILELDVARSGLEHV